jgi:hypothetical protein
LTNDNPGGQCEPRPDGVQPTNNPAERALSAAATCRLQRRSLFTYLSDLITAHTRGDPFSALT